MDRLTTTIELPPSGTFREYSDEDREELKKNWRYAVLLKTSDDTYREERKLTTLGEFVNLVEEITKKQENGLGDVLVWIEDGVIYLEDHDGYVE